MPGYTTPDYTTLPDGIRVVWQAHALGAILGVAFAALIADRSMRKPVQTSSRGERYAAAATRPNAPSGASNSRFPG
jgi:hypothetical protein